MTCSPACCSNMALGVELFFVLLALPAVLRGGPEAEVPHSAWDDAEEPHATQGQGQGGVLGGACASTGVPPSGVMWTYENITMHMASAWDENISVALQEEEIQMATISSPGVEEIPLPFWTTQMEPTGPPSSATPSSSTDLLQSDNYQPTQWPSASPCLANDPSYSRTTNWTLTTSWTTRSSSPSSSSTPMTSTLPMSMPSSLPMPPSSSSTPTAAGSTPSATADRTPPSTPASMTTDDQVDWWEAIRDRRGIRQNRNSALSAGDVSLPSQGGPLYPRDPESLLGPTVSKKSILKNKGHSDPCSSGCAAEREPTTLPSTSSSSSSPLVASWSSWASSNSSGVNVSDTDGEPGVTQRFGKWRTGRDRWHNPDGSTINRGRDLTSVNMPASDRAGPSGLLGSIAEENQELVVGNVMVAVNNNENMMPVSDINDNEFFVRASSATVTEAEDTSSTSASDHLTLSQQATSSEGNGTQQGPGFWRHGEWIGRPRNQQEQRAHEGGRGAQRTARKAQRVVDWQQGRWKPAWLLQYAREKQQRQQLLTAPPQEGTVHAAEAATPSVSDAARIVDGWIQDPVSGWWSPCLGQNGSSTGGTQDGLPHSLPSSTTSTTTHNYTEIGVISMSCCFSTTSSTTASLTDPAIPGHGLFPEVVEAGHGDEMMLMQMTPSERARLQEGGVPNHLIQRLENFLDVLQRHQDEERGPEARWGVARVHRRLEEGTNAVDCIIEILSRRLMAQGHWPVQRLPATEVMQLRLFEWAKCAQNLALDVLEHHLRTPLQPSEASVSSSPFLSPLASEILPPQSQMNEPASSSSDRPAIAANLMAVNSQEGRNRSRSPSRSSRAVAAAEDEESSQNSVVDQEADSSLPPPSPLPQLLQGPLSEETQAVLDGQLLGVWVEPASESQTTSTTTSTTSTSTTSLMTFMAWWYGHGTWSSTTTTSTISSADLIRDEVNRALVHGNLADVQDLIQRLVDRQRRLRYLDELLGEAIEEALGWIQPGQHAMPLNAASFETQIWERITREAASGSQATSVETLPPNTSLAVLLQPGLPQDVSAVFAALPGFSPSVVAGLRRRAWQVHVQALGFERPRRPRGTGMARTLHLVQTDASVPVPNWPPDEPVPTSPHVLRHRHGRANRRRLRARRPLPALQGVPVPPNEVLAQTLGVSSSLQDLGISLSVEDGELRNRSRSRDGMNASLEQPGPSTTTTTTHSVLLTHGPWVPSSSSSSSSWSPSTSSSSSSSTSWLPPLEWNLVAVTTTSTSPGSPDDVLRDRVNSEMNFANTADAIDVAHRLLAASRRLLRQQQRLNTALEEALLWFPVPPAAPVFNGPTIALNVLAEVMGDSARSQDLDHADTGVAVLLQPGLPSSGESVQQSLPGWSSSALQSFRRRLWRQHVRPLLPPGLPDMETPDLYLLQVNESVPVPLAPALPAPPALPHRGRVRSRRRGQLPPGPLSVDSAAAASVTGSGVAEGSAPAVRNRRPSRVHDSADDELNEGRSRSRSKEEL